MVQKFLSGIQIMFLFFFKDEINTDMVSNHLDNYLILFSEVLCHCHCTI